MAFIAWGMLTALFIPDGYLPNENFASMVGPMIMGPLGGWLIKKFDEKFQEKIPSGFEMLVNDFSSGLIGFALSLLAYVVVGPIVASFTTAIGVGVEFLISNGRINYVSICN